MLNLILKSSSCEGDLVMVCFAGSGTTLAAAFDLNRVWIGVDNSIESYRAITKRFTQGLDRYGDYVNKEYRQMPIMEKLISQCPYNAYALENEELPDDD